MRIYFSHYGYIWSYSLTDALKVAEAGANGAGCFHSSANGGRELKFQLKERRVPTDEHYIPARFTNRLYKCLDWDRHDWELCLEELKILEASKT